jgi:predicted transcriptional regulator
MHSSAQLSDLQLAVMRVIWDRGEATVAEVHEVLHDQRGLATTTVATVLTRLEKRGVLCHRREGRQFVYEPTVSEEEVQRSMVSELADRVFRGDVTELVSHLLDGRDMSPGDLQRVRALFEERSRRHPEE